MGYSETPSHRIKTIGTEAKQRMESPGRLTRQRKEGGPVDVARSREGRTLGSRLFARFVSCGHRVVAAFALWCVCLDGVAAAITFTEFPLPTPNRRPKAITAGPDGALWFTDESFFDDAIIRVTPSGVFTIFSLPNAGAFLGGITAGPDGALWFTEWFEDFSRRIGRLTPEGTFTEFPLPTDGSFLDGITAGPDGALWFTDPLGNKIRRITTDGVVSEFPIPTANSFTFGITAGPDGALWFAESACFVLCSVTAGKKIGRITTSGTITEFPLSTASLSLGGPVVGPDGALWFTETGANKIGRITTTRAITEFSVPTPTTLGGITIGPDGALWFTEPGVNKIGRITTGGVVTEFPIPTADSGPGSITAGPDGAVWFTEYTGKKIGRIALDGIGGAAVSLNGSSFRPGQTIDYEATLTPPFTPVQVDIYLGALLPDGVTFLSLVQVAPGAISTVLAPAPVPFLANVTLAPIVVPFLYTFSGFEPVGAYFTYAGLAVAGSNPFLPENQLSLAVRAFQFSP